MKRPSRTVVPINTLAWAIGERRKSGRAHIRRIVWGRTLEREEKREGETIWRAHILIDEGKNDE